MDFYGHLIKGEVSKPEAGKIGKFPNMDKAIENPGVLFAMALRSKGSFKRFITHKFTRFLPESSAEIRLLKDYIDVHGFPSEYLRSDIIDDLIFAEYAIGGRDETIEACQEANRIKKLMHKDLNREGKGLSLEDRASSITKMHDFMWKNYNDFQEIAVAEGTPLKLFNWQATNVFKALNKNLGEFAFDRLSEEDIPCTVENEKTTLHHYPFGSVGIFPPYNAALGLGFLAIFSSYFAGNATVTRTPAKVPLTNMKLAYVLRDLMEELDFPISAFQAIIGPAKEIANYMVNESPLNAMVYYGDSGVGLELMAKAVRRGLHFIPELAGSGASLVWKDIDIEKVAKYISHGRFFGSGQTCLGVKRLFLHDEIYSDFIEALVEESENLKVGLPSDSNTDLPVVGTKALYQIIDMKDEAMRKGAKIESGGFRLDIDGEKDASGLFYQPTILSEVPLDSSIWYKEAFGPILPIMRIKDFDQAITQANNTPYGLRTSVYSDDPKIYGRFFDEIEAPGIAINTDHLHFDDFFPHLGGLKTSGIFGGKYFYEVLTYLKYRHYPA